MKEKEYILKLLNENMDFHNKIVIMRTILEKHGLMEEVSELEKDCHIDKRCPCENGIDSNAWGERGMSLVKSNIDSPLEDVKVPNLEFNCPCEDGIDSKACVGCEHSEDGKREYKPYVTVDEFIQDFQERFPTAFPRPAYTMPMIWLRRKNEEQISFVTDFIEGRVRIEDAEYTMAALLDIWTYLDGSPCGKEC